MYSYEDRLQAVKLYIKYNLSIADTIHELGYPSRNMLRAYVIGERRTKKYSKPLSRPVFIA